MNRIERIWSLLKQQIRRKKSATTFAEATMKTIQEAILLITPDTWKNCVQHVVGIEDEYLQYASALPKFIIHVDDGETSDSDNRTVFNV